MARSSLGLSLVLFTSTPLLVSLAACDKSQPGASEAPTEDSVDTLARSLIEALAADDRDAALASSSSTLALDLDPRSVAIMARTFAWLGDLEGLSSNAEEAVVGGVRRRYVASFSRGELTLHLTIVQGKAEGIEFDEGQWAAYEDRALTAHAGSMRLIDVRFVDPEGRAVANPSDPSAIPYELEIEGLDVQLREHHVTIGKNVYDAEGHEVYRQDADDNITFPQGEDGTSGGILTGHFGVPGPGSYELELRIRDLVGGQDITRRVPFTIAAPDPAATPAP